MRKALPFGASPAAICVGVKKNTRLLWKALSTRAAAMPSTARPPPMRAKRLCLGFIFLASGDFPLQFDKGLASTRLGEDRFNNHQRRAGAEGTPDVEGVAAHGEEFGCAAPVHDGLTSLNSSTQPAWRSRSRMMA